LDEDRKTREQLTAELKELRKRLAVLEGRKAAAGTEESSELRTVRVPQGIREVFLRAQDYVRSYFQAVAGSPEKGTLEFSGERYIMIRAASMSVEFFEQVASLYRDRGEKEARAVANGFLFDIAHALGKADARAFHQRMGVSDPMEKLSAGPVHFAHSGWALVDILPESNPTPDQDYYLIYDHPYSFEVDAWLKRGRHTDFPVCVMNAGYSSGWCEESFGFPLVSVEVECLARGDQRCRFIMAPPSRIEEHIERYGAEFRGIPGTPGNPEIPEFFQRKRLEDALRKSEQDYRGLVEQSVQGIAVFSGSGLLFANTRFAEMTGYDLEELRAMDAAALRNLTAPEDREEIYARFLQRLEGGNPPPNYQFRVRRKDGEVRWWEMSASRQVLDGVPAVQAVVTDITGRKTDEERLRNQNRYNRLRAEIWRLAADESLGEDVMIQRLLEAIGPALGVGRACYDRVEGDEMVSSFEWRQPGVKSVLGNRWPASFARLVPSYEYHELNMEEATRKLPPEVHSEASALIEQLIREYDIRAILLVPCQIGDRLEGTVTLDVTRNQDRIPPWTEVEKQLVADAVQIITGTIAHRRTQQELREAKESLERRVDERTSELSRELHERTRAEEALRESETRFRALFESAAIGIAIAEPDGRFMQANETFRRMLGYSLEELRTMTFADVTFPEDRRNSLQLSAEVTNRQRDSYHVEKRYLRKDGSLFWANLAASAVRDAGGEVLYLLGVVEDITVRRMAQEELEKRHAELVRANRELEKLHRAKDEFVATVSHELRTPLVTGLGYIELLLEGHLGPVSPETVSGMRVALRNLRRLSGLIDDILSYSSLIRRDRKSGPVVVSVSPRNLLSECREEFLVRSGRDGSRVVLDVAANTPCVYADEDMIRRVVSNLLDNAHRHAGESAQVRLSARPADGDQVVIAVGDNGPGMTEEAQARVFEPFVKLSGKREGAGLGLAIVRSVLEAHGSEPSLRSSPGEGTELSFRLPVSDDAGAVAGLRRGSTRYLRAGAKNSRVLVVDDDQDTLEMVRLALETRDFTVRTVTSAEEVLPLLNDAEFDLVLLDMALPGMTGPDLCARIKKHAATAAVPVLMFSARAEEAARSQAQRSGCDGYIVKPIVMKELAAAVCRALGCED